MDNEFMQIALEKGWEGHRNGQEPFGACVVKNGEIISASHNAVNKDIDITAHAEINALREGMYQAKKLLTLMVRYLYDIQAL